ncbi:pyrroloquinoline quinone-dependent dehydrogenase [Zoogloea sp.]|uniref:pyrroloquinoline quinone-dependent dehydrogenase n=1 Tax=Zoogloea sp. TaxID=49181 RepID=UPI0026211944|nr:PQQ-binding-like beta-propeller repeat protein [uncultured Zoogloea sp.]
MRTPIRLLPALLALALAPAFAADIDWPTYGLDLSNQRYATPSQINAGNVGKLTRAWAYKSGVKATFQATPIMVDRRVYLSLPFNGVVALDAVSGKQLWRYDHPRKKDYPLCCGPANRGVAVADGKVFIGTVDARLVALDAKTGKVLWDVEVADADSARQESVTTLTESDPLRKATIAGQSGVGIAMAPVVHKGKVLIGVTGVGYGLHLDSDRDGAPLGAVVGFAGNYGRPGFLAAFDVATGKRVWQFDTIAPNNWEGEFRHTTPDGVPLNRDVEKERADLPKYPDAARYGGGSAWSTPAIDTDNGLLYFGTGNPSPQMDGSSRPGDNLYTVSLVCLDVDTGKIRWHYQQVPHDQWGYDVASPAVLFDYPHEGKVVPAVGQAAKIGWYYIHNRLTGELLKKSDEFVEHHNTFTRPTPEGQVILPGVLGGINWSPTSLDAERLVAYVPAIHWPVKYTKRVIPATGAKPALEYSTLEPLMDVPRWGVLSAIDLATGKMKWQHRTAQPLVGGVLATAGNLVFMGEGNGRFNAYDAGNGQTLWSDQLDAGVNAPPVTWQIDGVQYVGVAAGGNQIFGYKAGDTFQVYRLGN